MASKMICKNQIYRTVGITAVDMWHRQMISSTLTRKVIKFFFL